MLIKEKLCFALDVPTANDAQLLINELSPYVGTFKIGPELFISGGPALIHMVKASGAKCFLDLKLHDIPATVSRAVEVAKKYKVDFLTIHIAGGREMMKAAVETAGTDLLLLGVTTLTSLDDTSLNEIGFDPRRKILYTLAFLAEKCDVRGIVCPSKDVSFLKEFLPTTFFATPGIRPTGTNPNDQTYIETPCNAIKNHSNLLIIGRPIRDAEDKILVTKNILAEIEKALK